MAEVKTKVRAGWLTTKAAGKPVPFAMIDSKLFCLTCNSAHADRDKFIAHTCAPVKKGQQDAS